MYIHERDTWTAFRWDAAIRDIQDLVEKEILCEDIPGAKRPSYSIIYNRENMAEFFSDVNVEVDNDGICRLTALYKGKTPVCERILPLDAERYRRGDFPMKNLLAKYCSYIRKGQ